MWSWIKKHIGIIGGIFTFLSTIFFIYTAFFPFEKKSKIIFYEKTVQDVFSWKDTIDGLEIHCNGVDVRKKGLGLKMYTVKLINNGGRDIKKEDYGDVAFGLHIMDGKILGVKTGKDSDPELANNIIDRNNSDSANIILKKPLIGKGKYVLFYFWILYDTKREPSVSKRPLGRIADTEISYTDEAESSGLGTDDIIFLIKLILLGVIAIFLIIYIIPYSISYSKRIFRKIIFLHYYGDYYDKQVREHRIMLKIYSLLGKTEFMDVLNILKEKDKLRQGYFKERANEKVVDKFKRLFGTKKITTPASGLKEDDFKYQSSLKIVIDLLKHSHYLKKSESEIEVDIKFLNEIDTALEIFHDK